MNETPAIRDTGLSHSAKYRQRHTLGIYHPRSLIPKTDLEKLYLQEKYSIQEIATLLGCGHDTVRDQIRFHKIPTRTVTEGVRLAALKGKMGHPGNSYRRKNRYTVEDGYLLVYQPEHPRANKRGRVREHILVWEKMHHQPLPQGWIIHHLNGIRSDNRPENLAAAPSRNHYDLINALTQRIRQLEVNEVERLKNE